MEQHHYQKYFENNKDNSIYALVAVVFHQGLSLQQGRFTSLCRSISKVRTRMGLTFDYDWIYHDGKNTKVYNESFPGVKVYYLEPEEAITVKYFRNSFLATKVAFFNQIYDFCERLNIDYRYVREAIALDDRIGDSHTYVFDDSRGFGGHCFPKDTAALLSSSKMLGVDLSILEAAVIYNNDIVDE